MRIPAAVLALLLTTAVTPPFASAAWQPGGTKITGLEPYQSKQLIGLAADGANGAYLLWAHGSADPDSELSSPMGWTASRTDVLGNRPAAWPADGVTFLEWNMLQDGWWARDPQMMSDGVGGAIVPFRAMTLGGPVSFNIRRIQPDGAVPPVAGYASASVGDPIDYAAWDADGAGGLVAIITGLTSTFPATPEPLYAKRIAPSGATLWGPIQLSPTGDALPGPGDAVAALSDGADGGFFAWNDRRLEPGDPDLYLMHLDGTGARAPGWIFPVRVCGKPGLSYAAQMVSDGAGGVFVAWEDHSDFHHRIFAHHVLVNGTLDPAVPLDGMPIPAIESLHELTRLVSDGQGGLYLLRKGRLIPSPSGAVAFGNVALHRLDSTLQPRAGWPPNGLSLNTLTDTDSATPEGLIADGAGGAYVTFDQGPVGPPATGLLIQHLAGDGTPAPGWTAPGIVVSQTGSGSKLVRSGVGVIVAWTDSRAVDPGIYAQRFVTAGPVATEIALVASSIENGRVTLDWYAADAAGIPFTVERRTEASDWSAVATQTADGSGHVRWADAAAAPGVRTGFRLAWTEADVRRTTEETWFALPVTASLAIETPRPNPSSGAVTVALDLPDSRPARLELLDLAGRRLANHDLARAGRTVVALPEAVALAPGLYFVRLRQGAEVREARLLRVR